VLLKGSKIIPQLFAMIADEERARPARHAGTRRLAPKLGVSVEVMKKRCETLYHKDSPSIVQGDKLGYKMCRDSSNFTTRRSSGRGAEELSRPVARYMEEEWPSYAR